MKNEHRKRERRHIEQAVSVIDALHDTEIGQLVNIHEDGFMVIGDSDVREGCLYQLKICLSIAIDGVETLSLGAECLWLKETDSGTQHWAGFHIMDIADNDRRRISRLIGHDIN